MDPTFAADTLKEWLEQGQLAPSQILSRIDDLFDSFFAFSAEEEAALQAAFLQFSVSHPDDGRRMMKQGGFSKLLHTDGQISESPTSLKGAKILFQSIVYLSTIPFPPTPSSPSTPQTLSLQALTRGLFWLLPNRATYILSSGSFTRTRTSADHRRLVFQSLATDHDTGAVYDAQAARERAVQNSVMGLKEGHITMKYAACNHDDDGDEMFHDVLDVLFATQPQLHPSLAPVRRDGFLEVAKRIVVAVAGTGNTSRDGGDPLRRLHGLSIHRDGMVTLTAFLDELAPRQSDESIKLLGPGEKNAVTWSDFDDTLNAHPELLGPLYDLVHRAFLKSTTEETQVI